MSDTPPDDNLTFFGSFARNVDEFENGAWVQPSEEEFGKLRIKTRGFIAAYIDARNAATRAASRKHGGLVSKIGAKAIDDIIARCMVEHLVLDVDGIKNKDGSKVTVEQFKKAMFDPAYQAQLIRACDLAAQQVGMIQEDADKELEGNSVDSSATA